MVELSLTDREHEIYLKVQARLDRQTAQLAAQPRSQRLAWFKAHQYPYPISFEREIGGTVYTVNAHFSKQATETPEEKVSRILGENSSL